MRRRTLVALAPAWLAACAAPPQTAALRQASRVPRRPVELHATPFFPQTELHCGPAALATVLAAAGRPADPAALGEIDAGTPLVVLQNLGLSFVPRWHLSLIHI